MKTKEEFEKIIKTNGSRNLGWNTDRLKYDKNHRENHFSKAWRLENKRNNVNYGYGILQDLFCERVEPWPLAVSSHIRYLKITPRERMIVATVVQWLGTNVGWCWLESVLNRAGYKIVKK